MSGDSTNDNAAPVITRESDFHGEAAMLLVESLIHGLIERSVITIEHAVDIVEVAIEVQNGNGLERDEPSATLQRSITLLRTISTSLRADIPK